MAGAYPPARSVPASIARPPYVGLAAPPAHEGGDVYAPDEIERIRAAGRIAS